MAHFFHRDAECPVIPPRIWTKARILARRALRAPTRNMPRLWSEERRGASPASAEDSSTRPLRQPTFEPFSNAPTVESKNRKQRQCLQRQRRRQRSGLTWSSRVTGRTEDCIARISGGLFNPAITSAYIRALFERSDGRVEASLLRRNRKQRQCLQRQRRRQRSGLTWSSRVTGRTEDCIDSHHFSHQQHD
jgi:hypothetical protein